MLQFIYANQSDCLENSA